MGGLILRILCHTQMESIPDRVSMDKLQSLLKKSESPQESMTAAVRDLIANLPSELDCPVGCKAIIIGFTNLMIQWHDDMAGESEEPSVWFSDSGKLKTIVTTLHTVQVGEDDFMTSS